jgi:uncharacterized membrane protein HdeD (DUF308 family)
MNISQAQKNSNIYLYGVIIVLAGLYLLLSGDSTFQSIKFTLGISLIFAAILCFLAALSRKRTQVAFSYHEIHALVMLVYGISILVFINDIESLIILSGFLFFFYAFSEIIFCVWIFNLESKVDYKIVLLRVFLGVLVGIGTIVIKHYYNLNDTVALPGYGILFIIIGINIFLYVPIMKKNQAVNVSK